MLPFANARFPDRSNDDSGPRLRAAKTRRADYQETDYLGHEEASRKTGGQGRKAPTAGKEKTYPNPAATEELHAVNLAYRRRRELS